MVLFDKRGNIRHKSHSFFFVIIFLNKTTKILEYSLSGDFSGQCYESSVVFPHSFFNYFSMTFKFFFTDFCADF